MPVQATTAPVRKERAVPAAGGRKQATILFADFSGFTAFSSRRDPEEVRDCMQSVWTKLDAIIASHGGTPEKHSGDAVMAVFGDRKSREEDPAEAVRAALEIQAWSKAHEGQTVCHGLQLRIGIHTGLVVVGPADQTGEFLATGDAVNLACRLEQNAPVGGILISSETFRHVFGFFDAQLLPPLAVKGKPEPLETYLILRAKPRGLALQMHGIAGVEAEMIGRHQELNHLEAALETTMRLHEPRMLTLVGEGGLGKSRLLHEFQKRIDLLPQYFRLFFGRATPEITRVPFALIRDLFFTRFEIQESDPAAVAREKFVNGLDDLIQLRAENAAWSRADIMKDVPFIGQLLGFDFSASLQSNNLSVEPEQLRQRAFRGFARFLLALSQCSVVAGTPPDTAVLMILEDLHWADIGSLELIEYLALNCPGVPLMIVAAARPSLFERRADWCQSGPGSNRIDLNPLSNSESGMLVETILRKVPQVPQALRELITDGAEGNPFYIEEMIKMLMDQKVIVPQTEQWNVQLGSLANARVPATLTGVLQARLDGLTPAERTVLQRASVIGRVFWDSALTHLGAPSNSMADPAWLLDGGLASPDLLPALEGLRQKGLIFHRESSAFAGSAEFMFKHELLRNVAYESLLKKLRRHYHARTGEWLKDQSGARGNEFAGQIAAHFEQAAQFGDAARWHGRAAEQAQLNYAPAAASEHFKKALELIPGNQPGAAAPHQQILEWQEGLGDALASQARFGEALEAYTAMRDVARELRDPLAGARAWNGLAYLHERRGDNRISIQCAEQAEALASQAPQGSLAERVKALQFKGWAYYRVGDAAEVLALGSQTLELCTANGDRRGTATSYKLLGVAQLQLGHYPEADHFFEKGQAVFRELGDYRNEAAMWSNRGETARACGDYPTAVVFYEQALAIARRICHHGSELIYLGNLAGARLELRQFEQAEADLRQVIRQTQDTNSCTLSETYAFLSLACLGQAKFSEAISAAQRAVDLAVASESSLYLGFAWRACGIIGAAWLKLPCPPAGDVSGAEQPAANPPNCFAESLRVFQEIKAEGEQARTLRAWGEFELQNGLAEAGQKKLRAARNIFQRLGASFEVAATDLASSPLGAAIRSEKDGKNAGPAPS